MSEEIIENLFGTDAETRSIAELEEARAEIQTLGDHMSMGTSTFHKDLSLISLVLKRSGSESAFPLEEFIASIEGSAKIEGIPAVCRSLSYN